LRAVGPLEEHEVAAVVDDGDDDGPAFGHRLDASGRGDALRVGQGELGNEVHAGFGRYRDS
jgi:hypothetical protein